MINNDDYQAIVKDITGSRIKNRFTYEMYFGIKVIYDLYLSKDDFFVIFDYACDIETGVNGGIGFYQLKTKEDERFTLKGLLKKNRKKESILQKLVNLNTSDKVSFLNIVSNNGLNGVDSEGKSFSNCEEFSFSDLDKPFLDEINDSITWPRGVPCYEKIHFIVSDLCLKKPSATLNHYTNVFLSSLFPGSPSLITRFEEAIIKEVKNRADYEFDTITLEETIEKKGIDRKVMENIITAYQKEVVNSSIIGINRFSEKVDTLGYPIKTRIGLKNKYTILFGNGYVKDSVKNVLSSLVSVYSSDAYCSYCDDKDVIESVLKDQTVNYCEYLYDEEAKMVLAIYALMKC